MPAPDDRALSRRDFHRAAAAVAAACATPAIATAQKTDSPRPVLAVGDMHFAVDHGWAQLPERFTWQTTHNVAVGADGLVYVIHEGRYDQPDHPSIFVFDGDGTFVRAFGENLQGGGHGLEVRREGGEEFVYATAYQQQRSFAKFTTAGELVWRKFAPMESGLYADGEDKLPRDDNPWGRDRFHPTNFAFLPTGGFLLADGYGSFRIHRFDDAGNWLSCFGAPSGDDLADGTFNTPHGVWSDDRAEEPLIVVADRANKRLQWFTLGGEHRRTQDGFLLPANIDRQGDLLLVPDLFGRVTLLDGANNVLGHLGDDSERILADTPNGQDRKGWTIRGDESAWRPGKFVHPHDACFDADGNIYVAEWVQTGRVTKLTRLG
ncbi:MAG: twin-arginine translocation signal domain-containing protein [Planctomycetales bacterium]|nr:twin-arginine translocation signal domain-containing protein [Planctomycetales bacterium]